MKKERFLALLAEQAASLRALTESKGDEYIEGDSDQLYNFKKQAAELGTTPERILGVYLNKHLSSIRNHIRTAGKGPSSEPITGRIDDAILYLILLKAMVIEEHESGRNPAG